MENIRNHQPGMHVCMCACLYVSMYLCIARMHVLNTPTFAPTAKQKRLAANQELPSSHNHTDYWYTMHVLDWNSYEL